jgi:hypothetical protein
MPLESTSDVSDIETVTDAEGNQVSIANDGTYAAPFDGEPIDTTGTVVELDTRGKRILDLALDADGDASYVLEAGPDRSTWFGPFDSWEATGTIMETYRIGARYVRLRTTVTASDGSTASGFMEVS